MIRLLLFLLLVQLLLLLLRVLLCCGQRLDADLLPQAVLQLRFHLLGVCRCSAVCNELAEWACRLLTRELATAAQAAVCRCCSPPALPLGCMHVSCRRRWCCNSHASRLHGMTCMCTQLAGFQI